MGKKSSFTAIFIIMYIYNRPPRFLAFEVVSSQLGKRRILKLEERKATPRKYTYSRREYWKLV